MVDTITERTAPVTGAGATASGLAIAIVVALALVLARPTWRVVRVAVTLVHELGHAVVGLAVGRRFLGFVVRGDMSGHAITAGPARGPGLAATTWAGYPAPAVVGAAVTWLAVRGWAAPVIGVALAVLVIVAVRVRSLFTGLVVILVGAGAGGLWWYRDDELQLQVVVAVGLVLVLGAWRHVLAVTSRGSRGDDPAVLAQLTRLPRVVWNLTFLGVITASSWVVVDQLLTAREVGGR
jgi:hypothetical protein